MRVYGGVDTHGEFHVAAAVDQLGRQLGTATFGADSGGYDRLWVWMRSFGDLEMVGVEGTGSYGAGLSRYLAHRGERVVEVDRPDRQLRYHKGKSDTTDAVAAAHAALSGRAATTPKAGTGTAECLRALDVTRRSAIKARTQASNQIRDLIRTAPTPLRERLGTHRPHTTRIRVCARLRPTGIADPTNATKTALRTLARRYQTLTEEINQLDQSITQLCADLNPALLGAKGVGPTTAAALLIAAGDNPHRIRNQAAFAALCGTSPIPPHQATPNDTASTEAATAKPTEPSTSSPSTGSNTTHAPNLRHPQTTEGKTKRETLRCLKRYITREIYQLITNPPPTPTGQQLRTARTAANITLATAAEHLNTYPIRLSELERGITHDNELATRYHQWITTHHPN